MTNLGLDPDSVKQVDVGFDLSPFLKSDLDIWPGFIINEVLTARESGYDVNLIMPDDYGVHLYGITLFTTGILVRDNPDLVLRFLRAILKGWRWAVENPEEAGRFAVKYDPTLVENLQAESMKAAGPHRRGSDWLDAPRELGRDARHPHRARSTGRVMQRRRPVHDGVFECDLQI